MIRGFTGNRPFCNGLSGRIRHVALNAMQRFKPSSIMQGLRTKLMRNVAVGVSGAAIAAATATAFQHTQDFQALLRSGRHHFSQKQYSRALSDFSAAHARNPRDPDASRYLALTYRVLDRPKESAWILRSMHELLPRQDASFRPVPVSGDARGSSPDAPSTAPGAVDDLSSERRQGQMPKAARRPLRADEAAQREIAFHQSAGHPERTLAIYDRLLSSRSGDTELLLAAARSHVWSGSYDRATLLYDRARGERPGDDGILMEYAEVLYWKHDYGKAAELYRELAVRTSLPKRHVVNYGLALLGSGRAGEAAELLDGASNAYPGDREVLLAAAEANFAAKRYDRADALYRSIAGMDAEDPLPLNRLAEIAAIRHRYPEALELAGEVLRRFPGNRAALATIARVSSWQRDYRTSLATYDRLISGATKEDALLYGREKARVLSWKQDYTASIRLYDELVAAYPGNEALRKEAAVERTYYRTAYRQAEHALKQWLELEPENNEAWFKLGQIYFQQNRWTEAGRAYDRLLSLAPDHRNAREAREKVAVLSGMNSLSGSVGNFGSKSIDRRADVNYTGFRTSIAHPLDEDFSIIAVQERRYYRFDSSPLKPTLQQLSAGAEYRGMPDLFLRGGLDLQWNPEMRGTAGYGFAQIETNPFDNFHVGGSYHREKVIDNPMTYARQLEKDSWQAFAYFDGYRRWNARIDYLVDAYADGNRKVLAGAELKAHLWYEPRRLSLVYRLQNYGFRSAVDDYFSPSSFTTHTAGVEWQHYLNRQELFRGGDDTWYGTSYRISAEPGGNYSHQVRATLYKDWSKRFSTMLEYQRSWSGHPEIYHDHWVNAEVNWSFK